MSETEPLKRTDKPTLNKSIYINAIAKSYQDSPEKKSVWGWFLYDWLEEKGVLKVEDDLFAEAVKEAGYNIDKAKTNLMNLLIQSESITFEQIKATL